MHHIIVMFLFYDWKLMLLNLPHYFTYPPITLPSGNRSFVFCVCASVLLCSFLFEFLGSTYSWNHMIVFVRVISLGTIPSRSIHAVADGKISFFLRPSNIPLYIHITSFLSIHQSMDVGCFHILAIINNVAVNIGVQVSFELDFLFLWKNNQK